MNASEIITARDPHIKNYATITFAVLIALVGWVLMTLTSSSQMKGAAMLWLPAAFQLMAGVWLGPVRGTIAGGLGAYAAGILAYGGWGLVDIIMNPIAGGIANSLLPALLFSLFRIDPTFGDHPRMHGRSIFTLISMIVIVMFVGTLPLYTNIGKWAYLIANILALIGLAAALTGTKSRIAHLLLAILISIFCCAISAAIGVSGVVLAGNTWQAAVAGTGIGWFLGDSVSCFLGIYALASFTDIARKRGIA